MQMAAKYIDELMHVIENSLHLASKSLQLYTLLVNTTSGFMRKIIVDTYRVTTLPEYLGIVLN